MPELAVDTTTIRSKVVEPIGSRLYDQGMSTLPITAVVGEVSR
jgi:hypothetical protein